MGSNTIHLLVGEVEDGAVLPVTGEKVSARLGYGVDETGRIEEARIPVAAEAIGLFARLAALNPAIVCHGHLGRQRRQERLCAHRRSAREDGP